MARIDWYNLIYAAYLNERMRAKLTLGVELTLRRFNVDILVMRGLFVLILHIPIAYTYNSFI